jgi:hypothetical protein
MFVNKVQMLEFNILMSNVQFFESMNVGMLMKNTSESRKFMSAEKKYKCRMWEGDCGMSSSEKRHLPGSEGK